MAKGNMMQGTARGKVGDMVFARVKGQQTSRLYNPQVSNPRSSGQVYQRTIFADAVKFFTRGNKALFKFAFEDKKQTESDYNAFMRKNAKRGVNISKAAYDNFDYPALGNWIMTKGSLFPIQAYLGGAPVGSDTDLVVDMKISATGTAPVTVGQFSKLLIDSGHFVAGDILTFLVIRSYFEDNLPQVEPEATGSSEWLLQQMIVDPNDVRLLSDFETGYEAVINGGNLYLHSTQPIAGADYNSAVAIHSRNTTSGLKVSTQEIVNDQRTQYAIEAAREESYIAQVIASWQIQQTTARPDAILQGSIAQEAVNIADVFTSAEAGAGGTLMNEKAPFIMTGAEVRENVGAVTVVSINYNNSVVTSDENLEVIDVNSMFSSVTFEFAAGGIMNVKMTPKDVESDTPFAVNILYTGQLLMSITGDVLENE